MKIGIVGLGLIGASYASRLKAEGHHIIGYDEKKSVCDHAKAQEVVSECGLDALAQAEALILATYPKAAASFIEHHQHRLSSTCVISDVCGVKVPLQNAIQSSLRHPQRYISHHPMAGKAAQGFTHHDPHMFEGATCLMIQEPTQNKDDFETLTTLLKGLGFSKFITLSAQEHDQAIGVVSQLTHAIAGALMHLEETPKWAHTSGDSFADLTRIAALNAPMWTELFHENHVVLSDQLRRFASELEQLAQALETNKQAKTLEYLDVASKIKQALKER